MTDDLEKYDPTTGEVAEIEAVNVSALSAINRSEVECQLDAAHKYPRFTARRGIKQWSQEVKELATLTRDVAESCIYTLERYDNKQNKKVYIIGQSVRFAEIIASTWGNMHIASRIASIDDDCVIAQGGAWDLERNLRMTTEVRKNIKGKNGNRYSADMITMTGMAAAATAKRNAIFDVVPKAYRDLIFEEVRQVAVGKKAELSKRRLEIIERLKSLGAKESNIYSTLRVASIEDVGMDELTALIGLGTSIRDGVQTAAQAFPDPPMEAPTPPPEQEGRRMKFGNRQEKEAEPRVTVVMPEETPPQEPGAGG